MRTVFSGGQVFDARGRTVAKAVEKFLLSGHRDVLAGRHRESSCDQSGEPRQAHHASSGMSSGNAKDPGDIGK
jgi:hypothetical protein